MAGAGGYNVIISVGRETISGRDHLAGSSEDFPMTKAAAESVEGQRRQAHRRLAFLLPCLMIAWPSLCLAGDTQRVLRWSADAEGGAPYIFKDPNNPNRNVGFEVDIAQALERELGCRIEFTQYE